MVLPAVLIRTGTMMTQHKWFCGDSFEILPSLADSHVQYVLTDPPYDFNRDQKEFLHSQFLRKSYGSTTVFSPPENQWINPADQHGFWIKPISTKNTSKSYSRFVEMIFFYGWGVWNNKRHWSQYTNVFTDLVDDASLHPYRKPPSLIERLILNHTNPGDTVLDPFAGSGVVADVCMRTGRSSISIEISSTYMRSPLILV